ncbi:retrotransposon protein, putative, ty1-copia subclass [Tanacetum coccineum]
MFVIKQLLPATPAADSEAQSLNLCLQAGVERFDLIQNFYACKQEEVKSVAAYVLKMKGYVEQLKRLEITIWHNMGKTVGELHARLLEYEKSLPKKAETPQVMMIKGGKIQKSNKKSLKAKGNGKANGKGKDKQVYIPKPKNPKPFAKEHPSKDDTCHYYKEGFREEGKLKKVAFYLYVGNGVRAQVEAIGSYDLVLPNRLVICLDNYHYAPSITRCVVSVHRLVENGFVQCFTDFGISVSKNNVFYFNVIPSNDIYEIDLHDVKPNVNSIYNKRIEKLQHEGLLKSTDDDSFDQCISCLSGKMTRKSFPYHPERATDLLGIIHTDVCGPLRHVSRQGASYFITFTDDYSRYGYVYLLKHKHEVFETFKVFKNKAKNYLGKTIKALRLDRGRKYISQEFKDHLKACRIVQQLTPPYTPQHNGVSERRNRTLLDMVRSMMNLTTLPLSFWVYALESVTRILNMVPTKKVDKTPYELWSGRTHQAPDRLGLNVEVEKHSLGDLNGPTSYKAAMLDSESNKWIDAMNAKIQSMMDNMVWVLVYLPPNCKTVGTKGYTQLYGVDYEETFSPVADIRAIRILIYIAAFYDYEIWKMDVKTDFLNGYLDEDIYMVQPKGFVDPNYPRKASGSNVTFLILYVDDIIIMGNNIPNLHSVKDYLGKCFAMKDLEEAAFILGIKIYKDRSKRLIRLGQNSYMDTILKRYKMDNSKRGHIPMQERLDLNKTQGASTPEEVKRMQNVPYALAVGSIMYVNPGESHWTAVKIFLKYLRNTKDMFLVYGGNPEAKLRVDCYYNAGFETDIDDMKSLTRYVSF